MRHLNYTLTPTRINNVKGKARPYKLTDGGGLYVQVMPSGIKTWRYRYMLGGAAGDVRIGRYPEIGVADARDRHFELRQLVERGQDPAVKVAQEREELEARVQPKRSGDDVEAFSKRWVAERLSTRTEGYRAQILSRLERFVWPAIGHMEHDEPYMAHVPPGKTAEIIWTFNRSGEFEFACLIPGHYAAGMVGMVAVRTA